MNLYNLMKERSGKFSELEITGVTCDPRNVQKGNVFVCIDGVTVDGHKFAKSAYDNGAAVIICEKDVGLPNQILVEDSRREFAELCAKCSGRLQRNLNL